MAQRTLPIDKSHLIWGARFVGSALFLWAVFQFLPLDDVLQAASAIHPAVWIAGFCIFLCGHVVAALKWRLLIKDADGLPVMRAIRAHFAGLAANLCLPGVAGGDVVRAGMVIRTSSAKAHVAFGSLIDRLLDTIGLLIIAFVGGLFAIGGGMLDQRFWLLVLLGVAGLIAGIGGYLVLKRLSLAIVSKIMAKLDTLIAAFSRHPGRLLACLSLSMAVQSAFIATTIMLARSTGAGASIAEWFFAWPLAKLVAILPVSLAGLGVREAGLAAILAGFGADPARVVAASLLWQLILFSAGILGGLLLLLTGGVDKDDPSPGGQAATEEKAAG